MSTAGPEDARKSTRSSPGRSGRSTPACCPSCQIAIARHGELEVFEAFGDATTDTRYVVFSATKAFVASAVWALIARRARRRAAARRGLHPRVRDERQGGHHRRAGDAPHVRVPVRAARPADVVDPRGPGRAVRPVAAQLGAGLDLRVPPDVGALGARRDHRPGHRRRLPRLHRDADHRGPPGSRSACSARRSTSRTASPHLENVGEVADARRARGGARRARAPDLRRSPPTCCSASTSPRRRALGVPGRRRRDARRRPRALLPGAAAQPGRDLGSRRCSPTRTGTSATTCPTAGPASPRTASLGLVIAGDDGKREPPRLRPHQLAAHVRPQRRRRPDRVGRPRDRASRSRTSRTAWTQHIIRQGRRGIALSSLAARLLTHPPTSRPTLTRRQDARG